MRLLSASILAIIALLVIIHQYIFYGVWFEIEDIHHEVFIIALLFGALILYKLGRVK